MALAELKAREEKKVHVIPMGFHVLIDMTKAKRYFGEIELIEETVALEDGSMSDGVVLALGPTIHCGQYGIDDSAPKEERAAQWGYKIGDRVQFHSYEGKLYSDENIRLILDRHIMGKFPEAI